MSNHCDEAILHFSVNVNRKRRRQKRSYDFIDKRDSWTFLPYGNP